MCVCVCVHNELMYIRRRYIHSIYGNAQASAVFPQKCASHSIMYTVLFHRLTTCILPLESKYIRNDRPEGIDILLIYIIEHTCSGAAAVCAFHTNVIHNIPLPYVHVYSV